ncbi:MAG: hypothetical protein HPY61_12570 [Methanotrichaceae archaeon]|nr:hypothetical protein [Methanotrichaceae archaeon]
MEAPKKLKRTLKKMAEHGESPAVIAPAIIHSKASEHMLAMARMGILDRIFSYVVATDKNLHFIWPGLAWDRIQSVPLDNITGIEYVDEFVTNTLTLYVGEASEKVVFYDDREGIKFYQYVKFRQWKS